MVEPTFIPIGYELKLVVAPSREWLDVPNVEEICSVSNCISKEPLRGRYTWVNFEVGLFESPELARKDVVNLDEYTLFGYEAYPVVFLPDGQKPWLLPTLNVEPFSSRMIFIGHDIVGRSNKFYNFGCSPLSCNRLAEEIAVNRYCLIDSFEDAYQAAIRFGQEQPEPADYHLLSVYREIL